MERATKGHNYEEMYINLRKEYDEMGTMLSASLCCVW